MSAYDAQQLKPGDHIIYVGENIIRGTIKVIRHRRDQTGCFIGWHDGTSVEALYSEIDFDDEHTSFVTD